MSVRNLTRGQTFHLKKWLLYSLTFFAILIITFITIVLTVEIDQEPRGRTIAIILSIGCALTMVHIMGMVGAIGEHYCLVMSYSCIIAAKAGILIPLAIIMPITWIIVVIFMSVSCLAYFYAKDIHDLKIAQPNPNNSGQPNIVYVMGDYSYQGQSLSFPTPAPPYFANDNFQQNEHGLFPAETIEPVHPVDAPPPYTSHNQAQRPKFVDVDLA